MKEEINITKASGNTAPFSQEKLKHSLQRAGASSEQIASVLNEISGKLYEGITTKKIYKLAFNLLKDSSRHIAAKYHLKQAIMELGPSGFPFEKYVAEILTAQKYTTQVGVTVKGKCVSHEIDVIAQLDQLQIMIECKYHNLSGTFCDVKIPLYIHARFKDVEATWMQSNSTTIKQYQGWLVTNTRFSSDAIQYGTCAGLKLIGWDYPLKGGLKDQIDLLALYPITCLTSLTKAEKSWLLERKIVLCKEIYDNIKLLEQMEIKSSRIDIITQEIHQLCNNISVTKKTQLT
jgi:transcriptional regulator NrdR family protein/Holliday junction resolvase-like predicted endonuclease